MQKNNFRNVLITMILTMLLAACQLEGNQSSSGDSPPVDTNTGALSLSINDSARQRMLAPDVSLMPQNYHIVGVGPEGASFDVNVANDDPVQIDFLQFGAWTVTVEASNDNGYIFARGSENVNINVGEITDTSVTVSILTGTGSFDLAIEWPTSTVSSPVLSGLLRSDNQADIPLNFTTGVPKEGFSTRVATLNDSVPAGYYSLVITVYDQGSSGTQTHLALGAAETVRVLESQTTNGDYSLSGVPGLGNINIGLNLDFDEAINLTFNNPETYATVFDYNSNTTFTAQVAASGDVDEANLTYVWYLNGSLLNMSDSYTFDSASSPLTTNINGQYEPGQYRVDVLAFNIDGSRSGSVAFEFDVTGNPSGISLPATYGIVSGEVGYIDNTGSDPVYVPLLGAQISVGGRISMTDANGQYSINFVADGDQVVEISNPGYLSNFRPVTVIDQETLNVGSIILQPTETFVIDAASGGQLNTSNGVATVNFSANSIVDENGDLYSGPVTLSASAINPLSGNFFESFPGDFQGQTTEGDVVDIISFGVIAVELFDDNGQPLQIADGQTAQLRIAVDDPATAPATLPLWYLDETTGAWVEEGFATLIGNEYVGSVSHFSYWNFDYRPDGFTDGWFAKVLVSGQVVDVNDDPVSDAEILLSSVAGLAWAESITSDATGNFTTYVYVARNAIDPFYTIYARKDSVISPRQPIRLIQNQNATGIKVTLNNPDISMSASAIVNGSGRPLNDNGAYIRFGDTDKNVFITLSNDVIDGLEISSIALADGTGQFSLLSNDVNEINSATGERRGNIDDGNSLMFIAHYTATSAPGPFTDEIVITSNDVNTPSFTIRLEAGTDITQPLSDTVLLDRSTDHIGYVFKDGGGSLTAFNTATDNAAPVLESPSTTFRVLFAFDTSGFPDGITSVDSVSVITTTSSPSPSSFIGMNLYEGTQESVIDTADFEPANTTDLADSLIPTGTVETVLNAQARSRVLAILQDPTKTHVPFMLLHNDTLTGSVDLTQLQLRVTVQY